MLCIEVGNARLRGLAPRVEVPLVLVVFSAGMLVYVFTKCSMFLVYILNLLKSLIQFLLYLINTGYPEYKTAIIS